jgi:hypothetical protein
MRAQVSVRVRAEAFESARPGGRDAPTEAVRGHLARSARGLPEGLERD